MLAGTVQEKKQKLLHFSSSLVIRKIDAVIARVIVYEQADNSCGVCA